MAASASVLMRAYRALDTSYFYWRAGAYDPNMDDATGNQTPPHPKIEYSDRIMVGFVEGPLARSDATAFALPGLGTPGVPVLFPAAGPVSESLPGTDCRDFSSISCWIIVTAAPTTPSTVSVFSFWSNTPTPAVAADAGILASDDAIAAGVSPQNRYQADYTVTGTTAAMGIALGPFNVPVRGRNHVLGIKSSTNDVQGYAIAMRHA